ncbi:hypothetical protein CIRG_06371 [Coccidioides immitis RMSCC 2394]|uniref:Uncharacterized protein n=1 Tax=Coccidioides immitis RMSCC 2394 TaxID=404692 RepID=A0A0J6YGE6_COCIT|nr:hypothetical protein CIRG_06371 [Coccidioides immitis RMSCC 2394]
MLDILLFKVFMTYSSDKRRALNKIIRHIQDDLQISTMFSQQNVNSIAPHKQGFIIGVVDNDEGYSESSSGIRSIANSSLAVRIPNLFQHLAPDPESLHFQITASENGLDSINSCKLLAEHGGISFEAPFNNKSLPNLIVHTLNMVHYNLEGLNILAHAAKIELFHQIVADKRSSEAINCKRGEVNHAPRPTSLDVQDNSSSIKSAFASGLGTKKSTVTASMERTPGFQETSLLNPQYFSRKQCCVEIGNSNDVQPRRQIAVSGNSSNSISSLAAQTTDSGCSARGTSTATNTRVIENKGKEQRPHHMLDPGIPDISSIVRMQELEVDESKTSFTWKQEVLQFYKNSNLQATLARTNLQSDPTLSISLFSQIKADLTLQLSLFNNSGGIRSDQTLSSALFAKSLLALDKG